MEVTINQYQCEVQFGQYHNGNTAIQLIDKEDGELVAVATVNGLLKVPENTVGIKTWSENQGIVQALVKGNVIKPGLQFTEPTGFVEIEYYNLTDEALAELKKCKEVK